jgi:hypothetical protein
MLVQYSNNTELVLWEKKEGGRGIMVMGRTYRLFSRSPSKYGA